MSISFEQPGAYSAAIGQGYGAVLQGMADRDFALKLAEARAKGGGGGGQGGSNTGGGGNAYAPGSGGGGGGGADNTSSGAPGGDGIVLLIW